MRSSMTDLALHGIYTSRRTKASVTHVSGALSPMLGSLIQQLRVDLAAFRASSKMAGVGTLSANRLRPSRRQLESKSEASPTAAIAEKLCRLAAKSRPGFSLPGYAQQDSIGPRIFFIRHHAKNKPGDKEPPNDNYRP